MTAQLPVAEPADVRRAAVRLIRADGRAFAVVLALNALAAAAGLVGPWLLGRIIDEVRAGGGVAVVDRLALVILVCALAQLLLARGARYVGHRFGERTLARVREEFVERALTLPASVVERAGTGDLTARGTADVAMVGTTLRDAGPELLISSVQCAVHPRRGLRARPAARRLRRCSAWPVSGSALRWYLRRARTAYLAEGAATSEVAEILAATAVRRPHGRGVRTPAAADRREPGRDRDIRRTRMHTLYLRTVFFPVVEISYVVPVVVVLLVGGVAARAGHDEPGRGGRGGPVSAAAVDAAGPILMRVEQLQSQQRLVRPGGGPRPGAAGRPVRLARPRRTTGST